MASRYSYGHNAIVPVVSSVTTYTGIQQRCPAKAPSSGWTYTANDCERPARSVPQLQVFDSPTLSLLEKWTMNGGYVTYPMRVHN